MKLLTSHRCFEGEQRRYLVHSMQLNGTTTVGVFLPPQVLTKNCLAVPALIWLSGLTCNDENFTQKAGAQKRAAELGLALITPDTSPRGTEVPGDPDESWDFGHGAGFYVDALQEPWNTHYRMHTFLVKELPILLGSELPIDISSLALCGHSMGGHGALVIGLKHSKLFRSVSAISPVCHPSACPWGRKAFSYFFGQSLEAQRQWRHWDAVSLLEDGHRRSDLLMVDIGAADPFLAEQLRPEDLRIACKIMGQPLELRLHQGYDHSYFFIASVMDRHLDHHARALGLIV